MTSNHDNYQLLVDSVVDYALCLLDAQGRIASWNRGAERTTGYVAEDIVGTFFATVFADERHPHQASIDLLTQARDEGRAEAEGWCQRKTGERYWANVVIDRVDHAHSQAIGYACIARDMTERKAAEDRLRHSEEQFRLLVQGVGDCAIFMLDTEGRVTSWNMGAQRIKGYTREEALGKHLSAFYTLEDRANGAPERALSAAAELGRYESEGWRVRKDGSSFWANAILDRIEDDEGRHIGFAKITRDITQRRDAERALAQAREELFQSQKLESIGQLTGGVAHDFNNLLMAIIGSLELVEAKVIHEPSVLNLVANALAGAQRGVALTKRMLAFARKQELRPTVVDVTALIKSIGDLLQRSAGPTVPIDIYFSLALPPVLIDSNQLELALLNLVMNARDAIEESGHIVLAARPEVVPRGHPSGLQPGSYVRLSVTDDGAGMDAATLARATEPFFTTKGIGKGTGLGLPMVHGLAEQSGGKLALRSQPGQGTTVDLWLPVAASPEPPPEVFTPDEKEACSASAPLPAAACRTILVVDDDPLIAMTMGAVLVDLGHRVVEAHSAKEALRVIDQRDDIELLITDYAMPHMNGVQLAEHFKLRHPSLPVILASGYAELPTGCATELLRLAKPFTRHDLRGIIDRAFAAPPAPGTIE